MGIVVVPTTQGISNSVQAIEYVSPK
ncbi:phage holin family protein [Bacillus spizizenii]|nr:phage holin family protein [Bacillus spizizenii]MCY8228299.1 phage holin family protein [Bacillus spizizenii]MCY8888747.1 phage holin family protein [Bacillus spizizenii]MEC0843583.1 phage holin [Bacillus spizizenii]